MTKLAKCTKSVNAASDIRFVWGIGSDRHAAKRLARAFGVSVSAARLWLAGDVPEMRQRQLAIELIAEARRLRAELDEIERRWAGEINETDLPAGLAMVLPVAVTAAH